MEGDEEEEEEEGKQKQQQQQARSKVWQIEIDRRQHLAGKKPPKLSLEPPKHDYLAQSGVYSRNPKPWNGHGIDFKPESVDARNPHL